MLKDLTKKYIASFDSKNIKEIDGLLAETFVLEDPVVRRIEGKEDALTAIQGIFDSSEQLSFKAKNIYQENSTTIIEFILQLGETVLTGTDIIEWDDQDKMVELRAYLDIPK
jgi:hypothetical protein